jgi:hypothetical protein
LVGVVGGVSAAVEEVAQEEEGSGRQELWRKGFFDETKEIPVKNLRELETNEENQETTFIGYEVLQELRD